MVKSVPAILILAIWVTLGQKRSEDARLRQRRLHEGLQDCLDKRLSECLYMHVSWSERSVCASAEVALLECRKIDPHCTVPCKDVPDYDDLFGVNVDKQMKIASILQERLCKRKEILSKGAS